MLDHIIITVSNYEASKAFYLKALEPLGYEIVFDMENGVCFGVQGKPEYFIREAEAVKPAIHLAFTSPDRATVDKFYNAALGAGGKDNGPPGLRTGYHPNYYGAFVLDPDGNNIEAVCQQTE